MSCASCINITIRIFKLQMHRIHKKHKVEIKVSTQACAQLIFLKVDNVSFIPLNLCKIMLKISYAHGWAEVF